eukprot:TRINITY_DN5642_c0_g1_i2.p1 TRINITY_DN5642_c0_g1~~TRINITY_DN5642_c0_g1_i2.p1  ORF type:complete len:239 (-),score=12.62 TRINITY_DN5642_c0_g1_i2:17-733(-)
MFCCLSDFIFRIILKIFIFFEYLILQAYYSAIITAFCSLYYLLKLLFASYNKSKDTFEYGFKWLFYTEGSLLILKYTGNEFINGFSNLYIFFPYWIYFLIIFLITLPSFLIFLDYLSQFIVNTTSAKQKMQGYGWMTFLCFGLGINSLIFVLMNFYAESHDPRVMYLQLMIYFTIYSLILVNMSIWFRENINIFLEQFNEYDQELIETPSNYDETKKSKLLKIMIKSKQLPKFMKQLT